MIVVSSCLAGMKVRYNATDSMDTNIQLLVEAKKAVTVCPELLGGFTIPREPAEIVGGNGDDVLEGNARVVELSGKDVTEMYIQGAYQALRMAQDLGALLIVLKEGSPSCGSAMIYNGEFDNVKQAGYGVTTALLRREGYTVISEHELSVYAAQPEYATLFAER
ncbi:Uncharacterized conserved protein YbbK, DUF523 family [Paenibacillus sp. cl141a]|uniref:DUF523 domain-containing protein n=1 Tax=Paenibacillus sp. cl141a TaxID=1761877 RepID=UPI0008BC80A9|nr:DUF523 domain-containing protein [Paenibacillus sp. cl141a]SEK45297.1 Uncharacterized conserved protein YbbK, DUF523 family [Paenibacillus sp. cl141a]